MRSSASVFLTATVLFLAAGGSALAAPRPPLTLPFEIQRATLENGLRVVLAPDPGAARVGLSLVYNVGSRHEERGRTGFAHYFEHMMFQGSGNVEKGEHARLLMSRGGNTGAGTAADVTQYFATVPASELPLALWLEADRMRSLDVSPEKFENQRLVVQEEVRSAVGSAYYEAGNRLAELVFQGYWPYEHSTGGSLADIGLAKFLDVKAFHARHYSPNNAVLTLAGAFDPAQALSFVRRYFGGIPAGPHSDDVDPPLPEQTALRSDTLRDDFARSPAVMVGIAGPTFLRADHPALNLASIALGSGTSSRLQQRIVDKGLAVEASTDWDVIGRGPHLLTITVKLPAGGSVTETRRAVEREIDTLCKEGLSPVELEKARRKAEMSLVMSLEDVMGRASFLSVFELYFGDARLLGAEPSRYHAVTAEDVRRAAARYLAPSRRTVIEVTPKSAVKP